MDYNKKNTEKRTKLSIVPWYNKKEWLETYVNAYSDSVVLLEKAHTQMCIWKARYPNLPLGVECTMNMLHVRLCDKQWNEESVPTFQDKDLQLLYSTAVMRFLNHLSIISNCKDSMYKMAEQQNIPDWLINLRHEAAHGNSLPALYLLRQASDIIMQWLKTHYWETEAEIMEDFFVNQTSSREQDLENITKLLNLWLVLKVNYWSGRKLIHKIREGVRKEAMELASEQGLGIKRPLKGKALKKLKMAQQTSDLGAEVKIEIKENYTHKIKTAFDPLLSRLFEPLEEKERKKCYQECLIDCLVKHPGFCPQIDVEELSEMEVLELMSLQGDLWKEVLEGLQAHSLLPTLLSTLLERVEEVTFAHLWLRLLTHYLSGGVPSQPPGTLRLCQLLADSLPCEVDPQVLQKKADSHHVKHQRPLDMKPATSKELDVLQHLAQKVLSNPTKFTSKYLQSLLAFWKTPLKAETKKDICTLTQLYMGNNLDQTSSDKVYTVASLLDRGLVIDQSHLSVSEDDQEHTSPWTLYSGDADWSRCALGTLPF